MRTGRPRQFDADEALDAAMQLFWEKGFEATSKRDLMGATGVASQSLYNAFGDKRELFVKAITYYADTKTQFVREVLEAPGSPLDNIHCFVRMWAEIPDKEFEKGCFLCNSLAEFGRNDPELAEFLRAQLDTMRSVLLAALERAKAAGELAPEVDPGAVASALVCASNGIALMRRVAVPKPRLHEVVDALLGTLVRRA